MPFSSRACRLAHAMPFWFLSLAMSAQAQDADISLAVDQVNSKWVVSRNGSAVVESDIGIRIPRTKDQKIVRIPMAWLQSSETLEVTQIRLEKTNGQVVNFGSEAIRQAPRPTDQYLRDYSDTRRLAITIIDAEAGDLLLLHTKRDIFRPFVPGGFSLSLTSARPLGTGVVSYTVSVPSDMHLGLETRGFDHQQEVIIDRTVHYFRPIAPAPAPGSPPVVGPFDRLPRFSVSTFDSWDSFGRAYDKVLAPHAAPTPAIRDMATKLTGRQEDPLQQARLLFEWVRDHVHHVAIPLEESRPEPHDAEWVLTNLYGDDKDEAVLLRALLAARGIVSEFVLVNNGSEATIPEVPGQRPLNHMMLYLPRFDLYADPTLAVTPLGAMPFPVIGKPVIHLGGSGAARRTIPVPPVDANWLAMKTDETLTADGELTGTTETIAGGPFGNWLRTAAANFDTEAKANQAAIELLRDHGTPGTGTFAAASGGREQDFKVRGTFHLTNQRPLLNGGFFALWTGLRLLPRPGDFLAGPLFMTRLDPAEPTFCFPGKQTEEITLTIPPGRTMSTLPKDIDIDGDYLHFRSRWTTRGNQVTARREFESLVSGPICDGSVREQMAALLPKIRSELVTMVGLEVGEASTATPAAAADTKDPPGQK